MVALVAAVWAGCVIGVSFVATPIKFRARRLSYDAALEVGRVTFRAFGVLELALFGIAVTAAVLAHASALVPLAIVAGCMVVQRGWLLPAMDARVDRVLIARDRPPPSRLHHVFVATDVLKLGALLVVGGTA